MTLDKNDTRNLTLMRITGSGAVADLIIEADKRYGERPAMKEVNQTFSKLAMENTSQLGKLNDVLKQNPGLSEKILTRMDKDPSGFSQEFLPAIFKDPASAVALADRKMEPVATPAAKAPVIQRTYGDPGIVSPPARTDAVNKPAPGAAQAAAGTADQRIAAKMEALGKVDGFDDLIKRVDENPNLGAAMKAVLATNGTAEEREQSVDALLKKTKENPNFFKGIVQQIDEFPGAVNGIAAQIAGDPKNAVARLSELGDGAGAGGMALLSKMFSGGGFMQMIMGLINAVISAFGGSSAHLVIGNNNRLDQYGESLKAAKARPEQVAVIDSSGHVVSGAQAQAQTQAATEQNKANPAALPQNQIG